VVGGQRYAPAALPPGKRLGTLVQEAGWAQGSVWTGAENLAPTGIRPPPLQLRYPGPWEGTTDSKICL